MTLPPCPLPWPLVLGLAAGAAVPLAAEASLAAPLLQAVGAGLLVGLAAAMGSPRRAAVGGALAPAAALSLAPPLAIDPRLPALLLAALAGWEAARTGGRSFTVAIVSVALLSVHVGQGAAPGTVLAAFAASAAWSLALVMRLGLAGRAAVPAAGPREGLRHGLFLALGLAVSLALVQGSEQPLALWVVFIFLYRAMAPAHETLERLLAYATGALAGAGLALVLELLGPPGPVAGMAVAAGAALVGLRFAPVLSPVAGAAFTLAVLLIAAPSPAAAIFRIEAVLFVALLVAALFELLLRLLGPPPDQPSKP